MTLKRLAAAALLACSPTAAHSEGFSTADLGSTKDDPECLERGHLMFDKLSKDHSIGQVSTGVSKWSVIAFDVTSPDFDAIVTCNYGPNGSTRATLVLYSNDETDHGVRDQLAKQLNAYWDQTK